MYGNPDGSLSKSLTYEKCLMNSWDFNKKYNKQLVLGKKVEQKIGQKLRSS